MVEWSNSFDVLLRRLIGVGFKAAVLSAILLATAGALAGFAFPKYVATVLLQFPEPQKSEPKPNSSEQQRTVDPKANVIELAAYKRVAASYDSATQLAAYLDAVKMRAQPSAGRLLRLAEDAAFGPR